MVWWLYCGMVAVWLFSGGVVVWRWYCGMVVCWWCCGMVAGFLRFVPCKFPSLKWRLVVDKMHYFSESGPSTHDINKVYCVYGACVCNFDT